MRLSTRQIILTSALMLSALFACQDDQPLDTREDLSPHMSEDQSPGVDASDMGPSVDMGPLGGPIPWHELHEREGFLSYPDGDDPFDPYEASASCASATAGAHGVLPMQRGYKGLDETILVWGKDHYFHLVDFSNPDVHDLGASEVIDLPLWQLSFGERGQARVLSGQGFIHEPPANNPNARYLVADETLREDWFNTQVMAVSEDERVFLYDKNSLELFECDLANGCDSSGELPEALHPRLPRPVWYREGFVWLGESSLWWTEAMTGESHNVATFSYTIPRAFAVSAPWLAWIDAEGSLNVAHLSRDFYTVFELAIPDPAEGNPPSDYDLDLLAFDGDYLYWYDGRRIRGVDLDSNAPLALPSLEGLTDPRWLLVDPCGFHVHESSAVEGSVTRRIVHE